MTELSEQSGSGRVHRLWHGFEPNGPLTELIDEFTESTMRVPFLLRSTKEVRVDSLTYLRGGYYEQDKFAHAAVERAKRAPIIIARAAMRTLYRKRGGGEGKDNIVGYRMAFLPLDVKAFNTLEDSLDIYPSAAPGSTLISNHLYLDLRQETVPQYNLEEIEGNFKTTIERGIERRLFSATINGILSMETVVPLYKKPNEELPEDKSA